MNNKVTVNLKKGVEVSTETAAAVIATEVCVKNGWVSPDLREVLIIVLTGGLKAVYDFTKRVLIPRLLRKIGI